jgi:hypothetical protein
LHADVTMRMALDWKVNMALPTPLPQLPFNEMVTHVKGNRGYAAIGPIIVVTDLSTGKLTVFNPNSRQYATVAMADYLSKMHAATTGTTNLPDQAKQMLANMKIDSESHDTGRSSRILGIDAFEREVVIHMSIPIPIPGQENGLQLVMKLQSWKPKPSEFERVAALKELAAYNDRNKGVGDPTTMMRQLFDAVPGMGDKIAKMVEDSTKGGNVSLGTHIGIFMPGLAKMAEQAGAKGLPALPPDDQPLVEVNLNLTELSTDTVPDAVFGIPAGYKEATVDEVMKGMTDAFTGAKPAEAPAPPAK